MTHRLLSQIEEPEALHSMSVSDLKELAAKSARCCAIW